MYLHSVGSWTCRVTGQVVNKSSLTKYVRNPRQSLTAPISLGSSTNPLPALYVFFCFSLSLSLLRGKMLVHSTYLRKKVRPPPPPATAGALVGGFQVASRSFLLCSPSHEAYASSSARCDVTRWVDNGGGFRRFKVLGYRGIGLAEQKRSSFYMVK